LRLDVHTLRRRGPALVLLIVTLWGCTHDYAGLGEKADGSCATGGEACACFPNNTCQSGLVCASSLCVQLPAGGTGGAGGAAGAGGGVGAGGIVGSGGHAGAGTGGATIGAGGAIGSGGTIGAGGATGGGGTITSGAGGLAGAGGGSGGSSTGPCAGLCSNPKSIPPDANSGDLGTGAVCDEVVGDGSLTYKKFVCGNFVAPRTFTVNGTSFDCVTGSGGVLPAPVNGGYCMQASAGNYSYAYFTTY
jgi:hypothetical protein